MQSLQKDWFSMQVQDSIKNTFSSRHAPLLPNSSATPATGSNLRQATAEKSCFASPFCPSLAFFGGGVTISQVLHVW